MTTSQTRIGIRMWKLHDGGRLYIHRKRAIAKTEQQDDNKGIEEMDYLKRVYRRHRGTGPLGQLLRGGEPPVVPQHRPPMGWYLALKTTNVFTAEGVAVAKRIWNTFWSQEHMHFRTLYTTAETVGDWNGHTCWAYLIGLEAILEAEKSAPGMFHVEIHQALVGLEKHWSPDHRAYCAWVWFPGNGDIYIDR
ncbi:hypothetical protein BDZ91DRAFT_478379 [Kalaharituber pfeilii]|nr:hypothetical protein BDZ91DRAFT_478379 [Kalaharituber pfeilii]